MIPIPSLKYLFRGLGIHFALLLLATAVFAAFGAQHHLPIFWLGGLIGALNVGFIIWATIRLLSKKPIALTVTVSVFKYGFLIAILWFTTRAEVDLGFSFFIGLFLMLPSTCVALFLLNKNGQSWLISTGHN
jgi:hypothetical protein